MAEVPPILRPMLASLADAPLVDPELLYEPKYDGIRAIAEIGVAETRETRPLVRLWSRLGNEKTRQFPEIVAALDAWARTSTVAVVFDGEIVPLDAKGGPTGFQQLQGRINRGGPGAARRTETRPPSVAYIAFDVLRLGERDLRGRPLVERRAELERLLGTRSLPLLRISEIVHGDGRALYTRALARGWEGLIAKRADSKYHSGKRTPEWRKLKIVHEQEFVIGGWTERRQTPSGIGALLLGVYEPKTHSLVYAGHAGTGFDQRETARLMKKLQPLETRECPFRERPGTNETPHWVRPALVAQVKFAEWTSDAKLRHPVYLGLRDDKAAGDVVRESQARLHAGSRRVPGSSFRVPGSVLQVPGSGNLVDELHELEAARRDGTLRLPDGDTLGVTNLHKVFWPRQKFTKGDLFRYYVQMAAAVLPVVADRPLVMKRFPNGIAGKPFYQHRAPDVPAGVRVEQVNGTDARPQLIGGQLKTLLYMVQLAAVSQDPWFSRVSSPQSADHAALDLDPPPGVSFRRVLDVARWIRDELDDLGVTGVPKTSGADGLHIYIPLPHGTPFDAGLLFCQIIATVVSQKHPAAATVERSIRARGTRVYIDYLQNSPGKTLASAYSARASTYAGVSAPLTWREIDDGVRREEFTIRTMPERMRKVGDLWASLGAAKGADLMRVMRYAERGATRRP